jgi:Sulfotransferase family
LTLLVGVVPIQPVFIFSISRSGSTLLQRIIAAHEGVSTTSEPWLLLPHAYTLRPRGVDAEYLHSGMVQAVEDFCAELPGGSQEYKAAVHDFVLRLYGAAAGNGDRFFLDKSPPYCLVAQEVMELFPEGKFVFLWRNPLSIVASIIETWEPWHPTMYRDDLFVGLPRLVSAYRAGGAAVHAVRFEDLLAGERAPWKALMAYIGLDFDPQTLRSFANVTLNGRMGDPTGVSRYTELSAEPEQKWRATLANPLRKAWCSRYLRFLGPDRLAVMGYDHDTLQAELCAQPSTLDALLPDLGRLIKDVAKEPVRVRTRNRRVGAPNAIRALLNA